MAIFEAEGARIAYDTYGEATTGPKVVLLHGFPLNRLVWEPQVEELRGIAHFVVPDMRGHGSSDVAEGAVTMERMADDVHALVESLGIAPVVLVGLSMGGYVALELYRKYPGAVRGLVLADTRASADTEEARRGRYEMIEEVGQSGPAAIAERMLPKLLSPRTIEKDAEVVAAVRQMIETTSTAGIAGALAGMAERSDQTALLSKIAVPTLVVVGSEDAIVSPEVASKLADAIPGARLETIEGAGHLANYEKPAEFNKVFREFLTNLPAAEPSR